MLKKTLFASSLITISFHSFAEPQNLALVKKHLTQYHDSGTYIKEFNQVVAKAKKYLEKRIIENNKSQKPKKLAIVLDIDETSLSNYPYMAKRDFGGSLKQINREIERGDAPVLKPMLNYYNYAKANKVAVFFVTGRKEPQRMVTIDNLKKAGYNQWNGLYLKPVNYQQKSIISYKVQSRKDITDKGYDIVESIGDQCSDIKGGYADKGFKLPNPYYYLP